jgi:glycosyltransferase involved in cell wall biosynthesis
MSCSNLVIAHDNPFNREVLGPDGLYFRTSAELSAQLNDIESGEIEIEARRAASTNRIREHYLWDQIADAYQKLLEEELR